MAAEIRIEQQYNRVCRRIYPQAAGTLKFFNFVDKPPIVVFVFGNCFAAAGNYGVELGNLVRFY